MKHGIVDPACGKHFEHCAATMHVCGKQQVVNRSAFSRVLAQCFAKVDLRLLAGCRTQKTSLPLAAEQSDVDELCQMDSDVSPENPHFRLS
ncbi:hypothetical protein GCM10010136_06790 [Limoniibacter endophyticus]|uniref:Uncharacterized protein n=1 Tax=Limoniibacter endophyticus TaxID=1565040 RepID=A0A8J3DFL5_9HYPH|nr:hypothetical protein GCM10010136_06790 [Limoniibacter endophyticus]